MRSIKFFANLALCLWIFTSAVAGQNTPPPFTIRLQTFLTGLTRPVLLTHSKDGTKRIFILQQGGIIRVLQPGATAPTDFINISSRVRVPVTTGDERGLLGLAFHPQYATNRKFYVNYTRVSDGATVVAEYTALASDPNQGDFNSERVILTVPQPFANHNGGMIEFGPDGYLYIGMGDGGSANDPGNRAQNPADLLGKMLRIDVNVPQGSPTQYLIPPGNPFTGANTTRCDNGTTTPPNTCQEIWALGLRNPWRWSFDRGGTNQLWAADVGQGVREEVDIITSGANYGWRVYEGTLCNSNIAGNCPTTMPQTPPLFEYDHSGGRCSITGGFVYRGPRGSLPNGAYTYADYCSGEIWMWHNNQQILLQDTPRSIVSFGEDADGEIYVLYNNGQIDRIVRAKANADYDGDLKTDISVFRPNGGFWYINESLNNTFRAQQFGAAGDILVPEDYDGDNRADIAVFRPNGAVWYVLRSSNGTFSATQHGATGDIPVPGDYDGDAKADPAIYRAPSIGFWFILNSSNGSSSVVMFGNQFHTPVQGDYNGDGKTDLAVRDNGSYWYVRNEQTGNFSSVQFGEGADVAARGDFDGDGKIDLGVFRPSNGTWYRLNSSNGQFAATQFGLNNDVPTVGDYDGDGRDDISVWRPSTGTWYRLNSSNGSFSAFQFGTGGDIPTPAYDAP